MIDRPRTILQVLPKLDAGGAERVAIEIAEAVRLAGHRSIIAAEDGRLSSQAIRAGAELIHLNLSTKNPFKIWRNTKKLRAIIKENQVDLIHAHSRAPAWSAYRAARHTGIPFVTTYHGTYGESSRLKKRYNQVMVAGDRVVAVSHFIENLIKSRYKIDSEKICIIHNGVDLRKFDPASVRGDRAVRLAKEWRIENGQPAILLPARLTAWKGQRMFIRALAKMRHKEAVGILIGSDQGRDKYTQELMALAESLGVGGRLRLAGHVEDMPAALKLADIVVNCSTEPEAFGRTIIEAQAMGKIVVASGHGGAHETIQPNVSGFLFPPGDETALAAIFDAILEGDPDLRLSVGARARAEVGAHFSIEAMQTRYLHLYAELLD
ncbi:MAG: glycosyltransferase family 4 protein [Rhodospirillales bacterium]|nr:glycosyltransferase family 4 protein [Rhodospirillales bacterium]